MVKKIILLILKIYQKIFSPDQGIFKNSRPTCRFFPSCSQYSLEAIKKFGVREGIRLSVKRILKCHPWNRGGLDPIP